MFLLLVTGCCGTFIWNNPSGIPTLDQPSVPIESLSITLVADDYVFHFLYGGMGDGGMGDTDGDVCSRRDLVIPEGAHTRLLLQSRDYVYTIEIPAVGLFEPAVPGKSFQTEFDAPPPGTYPLLGSQMCGLAHPGLLGELIVYPQTEFRKFLSGVPSCDSNHQVE